jgi:hypothetical protein
VSNFEKDSSFKKAEERRQSDSEKSLRKWDLLSDPYDHEELAKNFSKMDMHTGTSRSGSPPIGVVHMAAVPKERLKQLKDAFDELAFEIEETNRGVYDELEDFIQRVDRLLGELQ